MLQLPIKDVIEKIKEETGLSEEEIKSQISNKLQNLDGLVSEEGAAYIVASELGVQLFKDIGSGALKIKNILAGMQSVEVIGRVIRIFNPITFTRENKKREVCSFLIGDETGTIRIVVWDQRIEWLKEGKVREGMIVKIKDAYVKESIYGGKEIHLGQRSSLILEPAGVEVGLAQTGASPKKISELGPGETAIILGTVVQAFAPRFYAVCPQCGKKVVEGVCSKHKEVDSKVAMIVNIVVDDGSETIRAVAFRERAERLFGLSTIEAHDTLTKSGESILRDHIETFLFGKTIEIEGKAVTNKVFERLEFQINRVNLSPSPKAIAIKIVKEREG